MKIDTNDMLNSIIQNIEQLSHVKSEDVPNIDLYMDQVTTFMETQLDSTKRYEEDKILTKTMINNYAKNNLLPPPDKKKYSKEHQLILIFIYYFKNILSIRDIEKLLNPLSERYFNKDTGFTLTDVYDEVWNLEPGRKELLIEDVKKMYETTKDTFMQAPEADREMLQIFSLICSLAFDVYIKKQLIEKIIDEIPESETGKKEKKDKK